MSAAGDAAASTVILVLGMHRSGTSAATRVLNLLGADLGSNLLDPQADNRKGFWEHHDAVQIHERLLSEWGRDWYDLRELPSGWLNSPASLRAIEEIVALIGRDFSGVQLWAVKDPRMCRLSPLWVRALNQLGIRATALIVVRDPREVAASLHVRDGWSYARSWLMWAQHVLESIAATEHIPRAMLDYDDLMKDWPSNVARIGDELHISWPHGIGDVRPEVDAFLSPADRHHQVSDFNALDSGEDQPPCWLMQLADLCADVIAGRGDWSSITEFHDDYLTHARLFAGPIAELTQDQKELERVALERMELIGRIQAEITTHSAHLKDAMVALDTKQSELVESLHLREELQRALSTKATELRELSSQHQDLQLAFEAKSNKLGELSSQHQDLQLAFEAKSNKLGELSCQHQDLQLAFQTKSNELGALSRKQQDLQRQHEDLSSQHNLLEEAFQIRCRELARVENELTALGQERLQLMGQLERARTITRSRGWLIRRIAQVTFRGSALKDVDCE